MKLKNIPQFLTLVISLVLILSCGRGDEPQNVSKTFTNLFTTGIYKDAEGTVEVHFDDGEVHITIEGLPELENTDDSYKAFGITTDDETKELGSVTLTEEFVYLKNLKGLFLLLDSLILADAYANGDNHDDDHDDAHSTHASMEIMLSESGMMAHMLNEVYIALVDKDGMETKILRALMQGSGSTEDGSSEGEGGHIH